MRNLPPSILPRGARILTIVCVFAASHLWAASVPSDNRTPTEPPQFTYGSRVEWVDGSRGRVVDQPQWRVEDTEAQWFYPVRFGGSDSLLWLLPEEGLVPLPPE